jgi:hypothetical protein
MGFVLMDFMVGSVYSGSRNAYSQGAGRHFALSFSTGMYKCRFENGSVVKVSDLGGSDKGLYNLYWPSYDKNSNKLVFEAKSKFENNKTSIFSIHIYNKVSKPTKIIDGRYPSISPDGNLLAYYLHQNQLWIMDSKNDNTKKIASDMLNRQPAVWLSNSEIVYASLSKELKIFDLKKGQNRNTGIHDIIPSSISPSGTKILCISRDGKKIILYSIVTNSIKILKKSNFLTMGSCLVWLPNDEGFIFTRQTWSKVLRFNEMKDLFLYNPEKKETPIMHDVILFGGAYLEEL